MGERKTVKLCKGGSINYSECDQIDTCKVCTPYATYHRVNENQRMYKNFDYPRRACKRDFPGFSFTEEEILEKWENTCKEDEETKKEVLEFYGTVENMIKKFREIGYVSP